MKLENYEVHLPSYSIGNTIYNKIGPVCESYGKTILVIGGEQALGAALDKIRAAVAETNLEIIGVELFGKDCHGLYDLDREYAARTFTAPTMPM